ncbi:putative monooxygenase [Hyaloraphidium curvatum]|nr:putative monooxygenase [Hyaloraphidium curvatum]
MSRLPKSVDVVISGFGPIGATLALLLATAPSKPTVLAIEKHNQPYGLPRAVHIDGEGGRILDAVGGMGGGEIEPTGFYEWKNAEGGLLLRIPPPPDGNDWMFAQPVLEEHLHRESGKYENLTMRWGCELLSFEDKGGHVEVVTRDGMGGNDVVKAKFLIGCDGAGSRVREQLGLVMDDLGFFYDWLIVDVLLNEPRIYQPLNLQICDPVRPATLVSGGSARRRRWEFMALPNDPPGYLEKPETAWQLLEKYDVNQSNAKLERSAVYRFQAKWGREWGRGRVWVAGDAAHLMPPFAGQGLCSGLRDVQNLSFKLLHLLLHPSLPPHPILSTYGTERAFHVRSAIQFSVDLGRVICITDPAAAAARDARMLGHDGDPRKVMPPPLPLLLGEGLVRGEGAGAYVPDFPVRGAGGVGMLGATAGRGWVLLGLGSEPVLGEAQAAVWKTLGGTRVTVMPKGGEPAGGEVPRVVDEKGHLRGYLESLRTGASFAVIRPDFYTFAVAKDAEELSAALDDLAARLCPGGVPKI